ncbi:uncharacterized protein [Henckelia pumila]|uniref:uncharacterized protein n=1 Tax=Henckelia pumila TaxID=405737 RepID=UPI003C6E16E8
MAWLYESVPLFAIQTSIRKFPRVFRWAKCKIPNNSDSAEELFNTITRMKIVPIVPFPNERVFVEEISSSAVVMSTTNEYILKTDVTRLEKIVREQSSEIENLKRRYGSKSGAGKISSQKILVVRILMAISMTYIVCRLRHKFQKFMKM